MAIVAGAPVCPEEKLAATVEEWERFATAQGLKVCYFGAESRLQKHVEAAPNYVSVILGSQPEWEPRDFVLAIDGDASLRAQLHRAHNKGVQVTEWTHESAENHPQLEAVLQDWLSNRGLPTLHFLVEPATLGNLKDRRIFVAEMAGQPIGFVNLCPVPAQNGWLTEQFVRSSSAPNGTVELMLYESAKAVALANSSYFTMGIVPLVSPEQVVLKSEPGWLKLMRRWAKAHYTRFYNFRGLSEFKTKFHPEHWQPVVVIVKDTKFRVSHLHAIGGAFTQGFPERALAVGILKAATIEFSKARNHVTRSGPGHDSPG